MDFQYDLYVNNYVANDNAMIFVPKLEANYYVSNDANEDTDMDDEAMLFESGTKCSNLNHVVSTTTTTTVQPALHLCKVCRASVKIRKRGYYPRVCEACQKFFRRHVTLLPWLTCTRGNNQCEVNYAKRRHCPKCRILRCLQTGMKTAKQIKPSSKGRRSLSISDPSDDSSSSIATFASRLPVRLVQDPMLYDGAAVESSVQALARAFAELHSYEFAPMKSVDPSRMTHQDWLDVGFEQTRHGTETAVSYVRALGCFLQLDLEEDLKWLPVNRFKVESSILFHGLPNNFNGRRSGVCDSALREFLKVFPEFAIVTYAQGETLNLLQQWNPSFVEVALLFGLLLFSNDHHHSNNDLTTNGDERYRFGMIRERLMTALQLHYASSFPLTSSKAAVVACDVRKQYLAMSLKLISQTADLMLRAFKDCGERLPMVAAANRQLIGLDVFENV